MCGPLMNIIKMSLNNPSKNSTKAKNANLVNAINIMGEKLLPQYLYSNMNNKELLNEMHNLMCYLCEKIRSTFHSSVVLSALNNNRDIDAIKKCLFMIFQKLDCVKKSEKEQFL